MIPGLGKGSDQYRRHIWREHVARWISWCISVVAKECWEWFCHHKSSACRHVLVTSACRHVLVTSHDLDPEIGMVKRDKVERIGDGRG